MLQNWQISQARSSCFVVISLIANHKNFEIVVIFALGTVRYLTTYRLTREFRWKKESQKTK